MTTGKNKERFKEWFLNDFKETLMHPNQFYQLDFKFQLGVLLAFYDGLEYRISVIDFEYNSYLYQIKYKSGVENNQKLEFIESDISYLTPIEAYKEAFKELDELLNKEL